MRKKSTFELAMTDTDKKYEATVAKSRTRRRPFGPAGEFSTSGVLTIALLSTALCPIRACHARLPPETPEQSKERRLFEQEIADGEKAKRTRGLPTPDPSPLDSFPNVHVQVVSADQTQFSKAIAALASQASVAIIVEAEPLHPSLDVKQAAEVAASLARLDGKFSDVIAVIAKAFGYFPVRVDASTVLLYKRFEDPNDLPFVTYEEALYDLQSILRATNPLDPGLPAPNSPNSPIMHLLIDLTKEHGSDKLRKGLPLSDLSPDQARLVQQFSVSNYLSTVTAPVRYMLTGLKGLADPNASILKINVMQTGLYVTGFEEQRYDGRKWQFLIGHGFRFQYLGMSVRDIDPRFALGEFGKPLNEPYQSRLVRDVADGVSDPTAPTEGDYIPQVTQEQTSTLKALAARLNAAVPKPGVTISVNPALGPKTVMLFNESKVSPEQLLNDVALVYGLRVQHLGGEVWYLTMPSAPTAMTIEDMPQVVGHLLPEPWQRALLGGAKAAEPLVLEGYAKRAQLKGQPFLEMYRSTAHNKAPKAAEDAIYSAAVHRFRVLTEPELKKSATGRVAMPQLGEEEKRLFALIWATQFLDTMDGFFSRYPLRTIADPSQLAVSGLIDSPTGGSMFYFGYFEQGHFRFDGGASMPTLKDFEANK